MDDSFRRALDEHLAAITRRDLVALEATLDPDDVVLVTAAGEVLGRDDFVRLHREWFESGGWTLGWEVVRSVQAGDAAVAVLALDYRDDSGDEEAREQSVLTLVFRRREGRWVMVHDQNTPRRGAT